MSNDVLGGPRWTLHARREVRRGRSSAAGRDSEEAYGRTGPYTSALLGVASIFVVLACGSPRGPATTSTPPPAEPTRAVEATPAEDAASRDDLAELAERAKQGDVAARITLSLRYKAEMAKVDGDPANIQAIVARYAEAGDELAVFDYGLVLFLRAETREDHALALQWLHRASTSGVDAAHEYLFELHHHELVADADLPKVIPSIAFMAERGSADAQFRLGRLHRQGLGMPQNDAQAIHWYRLAAAQNHPDAQYHLAWMLARGLGAAQDEAASFQLYAAAAEAGHSAAQNNLGEMLRYGQGVPKDVAAAVRWYERSAAAGQTVAKGNLGEIYRHGELGRKDFALARRWLSEAASEGFSVAQYEYAQMLARGEGGPPDTDAARMWMSKAAAQGHPEARAALERWNASR